MDFQLTATQQQKEIKALTASLKDQAWRIQKVRSQLVVKKLDRSRSTISRLFYYEAQGGAEFWTE
jgi:hypothetical protein